MWRRFDAHGEPLLRVADLRAGHSRPRQSAAETADAARPCAGFGAAEERLSGSVIPP